MDYNKNIDLNLFIKWLKYLKINGIDIQFVDESKIIIDFTRIIIDMENKTIYLPDINSEPTYKIDDNYTKENTLFFLLRSCLRHSTHDNIIFKVFNIDTQKRYIDSDNMKILLKRKMNLIMLNDKIFR